MWHVRLGGANNMRPLCGGGGGGTNGKDPVFVSAMKALNKKYNLFICTSPMTEYYNCVREKYEWVEEHLGFDFTSKMILTRDKTVVTGHVLIDDKPIIKGCMVPTWSQVVFDQPYNTETRGFRVKSWNQIDKLMDYIDSL